jgi:PKD repeat protein
MCINASPINLIGGSPSGGSYSGVGVNGMSFDPAAAGIGTHPIYYSYTDANSCADSSQFSIIVNALPSVVLNSFTDICENEAGFTLNGGSPVGGMYSGTGVNGNSFNPSSAGAGTYSIAYSYTDNNGCTNNASQNITVLSAPQVSLTLNQSLCENEGSINLNGGLPSGGFYSGPGVSSNTFDPSISGTGVHSISYIYLNTNSCSDTAFDIIIVNAVPQVSHAAVSDFCLVDSNYQLTGGLPSGGVHSGIGITGNSFNPSISGAGLYPITYTYTDSNSCEDSVTFGIQVNSNPFVFFNSLSDVCENDGVQNINVGVPSGGVYSGTGISGTNFDPSISGAGTFNLFYSYTDNNGCSGKDTSEITVFAIPLVTVGPFISTCENENSISLSSGLPAGGIYSGTAVSNGSFNPSIAGIGLYPITYSFTDSNSCSNLAIDTMEVKLAPEADYGYVAQSLIVTFYDSSIDGQSWSWDFGDGNNSTDQNPVHTFDSVGMYNVCLTSDNNGCSDTYCEFIAVITTNLAKTIKEEDIRFYPNPFGSELNFEIVTSRLGKVKMDLIDIRGNLIQSFYVELNTGMNKGILKIADIASGTYIIKISDNNFINTVKVEKGN